MAWLEKQPNGIYHLAFRFGGRKYKKSLRTRDSRRANARLHRVDENIMLVESGRLIVPNDSDLGQFLLSDGVVNGGKKKSEKRELRTLREFSDAFLKAIPDGSLEDSTVKGMRTHVKHLHRVFGVSFLLVGVELEDLQRFVDKRARGKGIRGNGLSPATIKKEITTLRTIWNWAKHAGYISRSLPLKGLRYPKGRDKPPFQTMAQIERQIQASNLSEHQQEELWAAIFLTVEEIAELLMRVRKVARHPFIYPMFVFAAHTGARRSEMLRSELTDIDFANGCVTIREKKRVRGRLTTRSVPLSPLLRSVLRDWIVSHPGGRFTFVIESEIVHSKKQRLEPTQITTDEAHDHFQRTMGETKWRYARGWHMFRHSFCSNCAAAGLDQRLINSWVGHQTEEMVRRYRHLIPDQQQNAIAEVFPLETM